MKTKREAGTESAIDNGWSPSQLGSSDEIITSPRKHFSTLSLIGMGYSISNTSITCMASLSTALGGGGRIVFVWGLLIVSAMSFCVAISLGELASAMPHAGGQYFWTSRLAHPRIRRGLSYLVGFLAWGGAVVTAASGTLAISQFVFGIVVLVNPDFQPKDWMIFVGYQVANLGVFCLNLSSRILPMVSLANLWLSISATLAVFITLIVTTHPKASAKAVFAQVDNVTGWPDGVAFISALMGPNWGFACLDAVTHMAEEIPNPEKNLPKALMSTVAIGVFLGLPTMIGIMFCVTDLDSVMSTSTGVPSLQLYYNATGSKLAACILQGAMIAVFIGAITGIHTWQSRMAWSFARDNGWPFSSTLSKLAPAPMSVPLMAHVWSCAWVAALGCVYLGSSEAFGSLVSGGILLQYLSYSICIALLLCYGRDWFSHGPFWFPRLGFVANIVTILWTLVTLAFYCLPSTKPTTANTMNYVSAVLVFMLLYSGAFWVFGGRKHYVTP